MSVSKHLNKAYNMEIFDVPPNVAGFVLVSFKTVYSSKLAQHKPFIRSYSFTGQALSPALFFFFFVLMGLCLELCLANFTAIDTPQLMFLPILG